MDRMTDVDWRKKLFELLVEEEATKMIFIEAIEKHEISHKDYWLAMEMMEII